MKIQEHTDLEVYKKAFDAAMLRRCWYSTPQRIFQKKRFIHSLTRFGDRHGRFAL